MKRGLVFLGFSAIAALCVGCAGSANRTFTSADRVSIAKVLDDQRDAWNRGDIEAFMEGYVKGDELVFTSGSQVRRGWQVTLDRYRSRYGEDATTMGQLGFELLGIQSLGADGAVVLGRWKLSGLESPAGGVFSVVLARATEGWQIVHDHTSSDAKPSP